MLGIPEVTTDFNQFEDSMQFTATSQAFLDEHAEQAEHAHNAPLPCPRDNCPSVFILERRVDRHRKEIEELKVMVQANVELVKQNSKETSEILEIVRMGKVFFKALGWTADKLKSILAIVGAVSAFIYWLTHWGSK